MNSKVETLISALLQGKKMPTRDMCIALGWQGGTIHQIASETKLPVDFLLKAQS